MTPADENVSLSRSICWTSSWRYTMNIGSDSSCGQRPRRLESLHRFLAAQSRQLGVRVAHVTGDRVVEGPEVLEVVEKLFHTYSYSSAG